MQNIKKRPFLPPVQFFLSDDCTEAFHCDSDVGGGDGCLYQCPEGQLIVPDFANGLYKCVEEGAAGCRGGMEVRGSGMAFFVCVRLETLRQLFEGSSFEQ